MRANGSSYRFRNGQLIPLLPVPHRSKPWNHDLALGSPGCGLPLIRHITDLVVVLRRKPPMNLHPYKLRGASSPLRGGQEAPESIRAEVAPADWHTLQTEGSARRHIDVLPVDEDRNSDDLRGKHCGRPASRAREPNGGEE